MEFNVADDLLMRTVRQQLRTGMKRVFLPRRLVLMASIGGLRTARRMCQLRGRPDRSRCVVSSPIQWGRILYRWRRIPSLARRGCIARLIVAHPPQTLPGFVAHPLHLDKIYKAPCLPYCQWQMSRSISTTRDLWLRNGASHAGVCRHVSRRTCCASSTKRPWGGSTAA